MNDLGFARTLAEMHGKLSTTDAMWLTMAMIWQETGRLSYILPILVLLGETDRRPSHPLARRAGEYLARELRVVRENPAALSPNMGPARA